jgi:hypothetical protein
MSDRAARERVFDLTPEMLFRRGDGIEVVRLDVLERMVRSGPITGYAPWAPESKTATRVWAAIGARGLVLFDRKTRIAHHWEHQDPSKLATALKLLKPLGLKLLKPRGAAS